jgi:hypothetical protein
MAEQGLIGRKEAAGAEVRVSEEEIVDFSVDWCRVFVTPERFVVTSQQAPWVRLSDLCLKLFCEIVPDAKVRYMGINRTIQFETGSLKARDKLGRDLAPRDVWGEWGKILDGDPGKGDSGLSTITMRQGHELNDRKAGHIEARLSPGVGTSVVITVNDHYDAETGDGVQELMGRVKNNFEASIKRSEWIVDQIMKRIKP